MASNRYTQATDTLTSSYKTFRCESHASKGFRVKNNGTAGNNIVISLNQNEIMEEVEDGDTFIFTNENGSGPKVVHLKCASAVDYILQFYPKT